MKIFIVFYLFLCSFELIVSSPITKIHFDAYNEAVVKLESSMKTIAPQVNNYFSKVHHIIKKESVKENKLFATTQPTEETGKNIDTKASLVLDKGINDRRNNDTNINESSIKVYPDTDFGPYMETAIFNITIKSDGTTEIEKVKMNSAGKSLFDNVSNKQISDIESHTVNFTQKKTFDNDNKDVVSEIEKFDHNSSNVSSQHSQTNKDIFVTPRISFRIRFPIKFDETTEIERVEMNLAGKSLFNHVSNKQISDNESHTVHSTQKKTFDNDSRDAVSEIEKFNHNSSKVSSQRSQTNEDIFITPRIKTLSQNKNDTIGENSENKLLQDEHFNDSVLKRNIDISNLFSSTTLKTGYYLKENNYVENKTFNSTKQDPQDNKKNPDLNTETLLTGDLDHQNKLNKTAFEKSKAENHSKILENLENKITVTSSGIDSPSKENGKSSVKENSEMIKYRQNEQVVTETNMIKNSTSLLNDTEASQINDEKESKKESKSTEIVSSTKSAISMTEDNRKKNLTSVTKKKDSLKLFI